MLAGKCYNVPMSFTPAKPFFFGETLSSLTERLTAAGFPAFRAKQVLEWVYKRFTLDPAAMGNLGAPLKLWLAENFCFTPATRVLAKGDPDTTQKLLLRMEDGALIETVLIQAPDFDDPSEKLRRTVCLSTQVGCACGCKFCASGIDGWKRDLLAGEIVAELFEIIRLEPARLTDTGLGLPFDNIVVMGMGEPLLNFENLTRALEIINAPWGLKFGARRITVSTSGIVPRILELAERPAQFRLAISLHGSTDEVRSQIMPINRRYGIAELMQAARAYNKRHNRMLTFEYILIDSLNDTFEQAQALIRLCRGEKGEAPLRAHINCIPYNRVEGLPWRRPSILRQQAFVKQLRLAGLSVTVRHEKGKRIEAACGQLRLKEERKAARGRASSA